MENLIYLDRRGTSSIKWDTLQKKYKKDDMLGMWIADMDFCAPACVRQAVEEHAKQGLFGYYLPPDNWQQSYIDWQNKHYGWHVEKEWMRYAPNAVSALHFCICALTQPGDAIASVIPMYPAILSAPARAGRRPVTVEMINEDGHYRIDFDALERCFAQEQVRMLIHCSPHNPVGRVWSEEEQLQLLKLCEKYDVFILSDEVHQDLCQPPHRHFPLGLYTEYAHRVICVTSTAKTFNLASCGCSTVVIPDEENRKKVDEMISMIAVTKGGSFDSIAARAAYAGGEEWVQEVVKQIGENNRYIVRTLKEKAPGVVISPLEGTYLMWLDFSNVIPAEEMRDFIVNECGLAINFGEEYGGEAYRSFVRLNIATCFDNVKLAVERIVNALRARGAVQD